MSWSSIREHARRTGASTSTVRRQIREGRLFAKKFDGQWFVQERTAPPPTDNWNWDGRAPVPTALAEMRPESRTGNELEKVVEFSSKALHHYLILNDKLLAEKERRLNELQDRIEETEQSEAELEAYVKMLEAALARREERR